MVIPQSSQMYEANLRSFGLGAVEGFAPAIAWWRGLTRPEDSSRPLFARAWGDLDLWRVLQVSTYFQGKNPVPDLTPGEQFIRALHGAQTPFVYLILSERGRLAHYFGTAGANPTFRHALLSALTSGWPYVAQRKVEDPSRILGALDRLPEAVYCTGIPHVSEPTPDVHRPPPIDRLLQALAHRQAPWAYILTGWPVSLRQVTAFQQQVAETVTNTRIDHLQDNAPGHYNRAAQVYVDLLESYLKLLEEASVDGGWLYWSYGLSASALQPAVCSALMLAFAGPQSSPEPFRWHSLTNGAPSPRPDGQQVTFLSSRRLAALSGLPAAEYPGLEVVQSFRFDQVAHSRPMELGTIDLGPIMDGRRRGSENLVLGVGDLVRHAFVTGITGSGKTNTVFGLATAAYNAGIRLLIVEPVKHEYRRLGLPGLRVYRMGAPGCPLRLNPFAFEGVSCSTHIDYLIALFNAAYVLYAPMPYVLEQSIHEIYRDKGWDLASGMCWRTAAGHPRSFPTLTDLHRKVGEVVARLGYDTELSSDIKAALQLRIGNLRLGSKGLLLDTRESATLDDLFEQPTCVEMEAIGSEEQRAFLIGLLLTKIYEGCVAKGPSDKGLTRLLIVEEAHRLLENVARTQGADFANPQAKAIQTFANILAEMRAYGLGIVVAEQIPSRIAPEVRKNVATFIVHTLIDAEERETVGTSLGLRDEDLAGLLMLQRGEALVFQPGMDRPIQVAVHKFKPDEPTAGEAGDSQQQPIDEGEVQRQAATREILEDVAAAQSLMWLGLATVEGDSVPEPELIHACLGDIKRASPLALEPLDALIDAAGEVARLWADNFASEAGRVYQWSFAAEEEVCTSLATALAELFSSARSPKAPFRAEEWLARFRPVWDSLLMDRSPHYAGCEVCERRCRYQAFVRSWLGPAWDAALDEAMADELPYDAISLQALRLASYLAGPAPDERLRQVAVCCLTHQLHRSGLSYKDQLETVELCNSMMRAGGLVGD